MTNAQRKQLRAAYRHTYHGPGPLGTAELRTLVWIANNGGTCTLSGDTLVGGDAHHLRKRDSTLQALSLILRGLLSTEGGVMRITPAAKDHLQHE